jgi:phage tail-like protein
MARPQNSDFLQGFRYQVSTGEAQVKPFDPEAGFTSVSIPEISLDPVEYREGIYTWTRKQPGIPTVSDISLARGVTQTDTNFYDWIMAAINGAEYRTDLVIKHYHREGMGVIGSPVVDAIRQTEAKSYFAYEAFPSRCKVAGDLEGTTGDISLQEIDVVLERLEMKIGE